MSVDRALDPSAPGAGSLGACPVIRRNLVLLARLGDDAGYWLSGKRWRCLVRVMGVKSLAVGFVVLGWDAHDHGAS